jgi:predicted nucleic acid-binding protein
VSNAVVLDAGPLGMLCNPNNSRQPMAIRLWVVDLLKAGRRVILPEIADYEIRRELNRIQSHTALTLLNVYGTRLEYLPLNTAAMRCAADLWAQSRNMGQQTAADSALDCDVILAAQTLTLGAPAIIATTNIAHLSRFTPAELWQNIIP